jgi:L-arabinokinase
MLFTYYVSGHGFGHASRSVEVINAIAARDPQARFVVRTSAAAWFIERSAKAAVRIVPDDVDTGMVQRGSLRLDIPETARQAARFYSTYSTRVDDEARALREAGASIVVGDIPPLAFAAAAQAGLPSVAIANFTWDWIYARYPECEAIAPGTIETIAASYALAGTTLRLPFHGGFDTMRTTVRDIPLIARRSARSRAEVRRLLGLPAAGVVVIVSFGAYGVEMPLDAIARANDLTIVVTDQERGAGGPPAAPPLRHVTAAEMTRHGLRYEDLVAASDIIVSKPGYGIVSECIANGAALLYTDRGRFAEHDVFVAQMPDVLRTRFIPQDDLVAGQWREPVVALLRQPAPPRSLATNGAAVAADVILST